jgi:hypothetical protein
VPHRHVTVSVCLYEAGPSGRDTAPTGGTRGA